jgi:hypothetical protein
VATVGLFLLAALRATAAASYLVAVVASQLLSPVLWDHYAMLLLLPVAYLLERGHWWAVLVPLSSAVFLIGVTPPIAYPLAFWIAMATVAIVGLRKREAEPAAPMAAIRT